MKSKYSSYSHGLRVSDIVYYKYNLSMSFLNSEVCQTYRALVLDREFLYAKQTRFGIRSFFKYKFMCLEKRQFFYEETKNIRTVKYIKGGWLWELG